jgi:uncharacterized membrane protein YjgN (DUF898 family)
VAEPEAAPKSEAHSGSDPQAIAVTFSGRAGEFTQIWLVNLALTLASCGLYMPWARVRTRRYFVGQTRLQSSGFDYSANPRALFLGWLVIGLGFSLVSGFSDLLTANLAAAVELVVKKPWVVAAVTFAAGLLTLALQGTIFAWLLLQSLRYNANQTTYRHLRFGFGTVSSRLRLWREMALLLVLGVLVPVSLGLLQPYVAWRWRRFLIRHRRFGTTPFAFTATPADFRRLHLRALPLLLTALAAPFVPLAWLIQGSAGTELPTLVLIVVTVTSLLLLLVWSCWLEARAAILTWRHTLLGELRFDCAWRARELLGLRLIHGLALLLSLGLLWPWVRIREVRYRLGRIRVSPLHALDRFLAAEEEQVSALAEGGFALEDAMSGLFDISF